MRAALRPCPHREVLAGPDATPSECEQWAAALAAAGCPACTAGPAPVAPAPLPALPPDVAAALAQDGRDGARRAQAALDAMGVGAGLYGAVVARLRAQPGTCLWWRRWWAGWREGVLLACEAAPTVV